MGTMANELTLGCDCLGKIHYLVSQIKPDNARSDVHSDDLSSQERMSPTMGLLLL